MSHPEPDNLPEPAPDTDALLTELEREVALDRQMHNRHKKVLIAYVLLLILFRNFGPKPSIFPLIWMLISVGTSSLIFYQQKKRTVARRALIEKLKGSVRAVGGLMLMVLKAAQGDYKSSAVAILKQTLPTLRASDSQHLTPEHLTAMTRLLAIGDTELKIAILRALQQVGDEQAVTAVEKLAANTKKEQVREAAKECLPFLRERAEAKEKERTLLRPSSAISTAAPETLLRPASAALTPQAQEQLLRPVE